MQGPEGVFYGTIEAASTANADAIDAHTAALEEQAAAIEATASASATAAQGAGIGTGRVTFAATASPGWLLCQGQAVSRLTYAALFAVIGTTYGAGDGATTFNVPNAQGRFLMGVGGSHALGATGGAEGASGTLSHSASSGTGVVAESGGSEAQTLDTNVNLTHGGTDKVGRHLHTHGAPSYSDHNLSGVGVLNPFLVVQYEIFTGVG